MGPNARGNFSILPGGSYPKTMEKSDPPIVPTAAIICLAISGYILLILIALIIRRCLKTNENSKFTNCCTWSSNPVYQCPQAECPSCPSISCFEGFKDNFTSYLHCRHCSSCCNFQTLIDKCTNFFTCGRCTCCELGLLFPLCAGENSLCQCGKCNCVCACQLPQCQSINCCCFEIRCR